MTGRPIDTEAAPYYFTYIHLVQEDDVLHALEKQAEETPAFLTQIAGEKSLHRYAPEKWSMREVLQHVNDTERVFAYRALWFARGYEAPLPSFDQEIAVAAGAADHIAWPAHIEEFRRVRLATLSFFQNLPSEAWSRGGIASEKRFTVRALAFIIAGHVTHHCNVLRERYL